MEELKLDVLRLLDDLFNGELTPPAIYACSSS